MGLRRGSVSAGGGLRFLTHGAGAGHDRAQQRDDAGEEEPSAGVGSVSGIGYHAVESLPEIDMAVHVRLGDFQILKPGQSFEAVGQTRTPLQYFIEVVRNARVIAKREVPVTVFSDGPDTQLAALLELPNVQRATAAPAIVDIYRMAQSKLLVCAAGSTFSYWSAYLGDQATILHRDHIHGRIRPLDTANSAFEGGVSPNADGWPRQLVDQIKSGL